MKHMYYHSFPNAPTALVSGIACVAKIPTIVGAYVGVEDNSLFLDVFQNEDFRVKVAHLEAVADMCGVTLDEMEVGPGFDDEHLSITLETTCFDFSNLRSVWARPVRIQVEVDPESSARFKRLLDRIHDEIERLKPKT